MARVAVLCALLLGGLLTATTLSSASDRAVPSGNLVQNPGAESVTTSGSRTKPAGWSTDTGFVAMSYADGGPFVVGTADKPDSPRGAPSSGGAGGSHYFSGPACRTAGCADNPYNNLGAALDNGGSEARQSVSVAGAAAEIDAGGVKATLSALMGGYRGLATVTATFLDGGGTRLGAITLGPVGTEGMTSRSSVQAVPAKTRTVAIVLAEKRADGSIPGYGFFDNVSLTLSGGGAPPPTTTPAGTDPIEGPWIFGKDTVVISKITTGRFVGKVSAPGSASCPYKAGEAIWQITKAGAGHYTGTHLSHKRDCSPDPGYPATWDLITVKGKTALRMRVTARDGYQVYMTLTRPGSGSGDLTQPSVKALPSSGRAGTYVRLRFQVSDNSDTTREEITVYRGSTAVGRTKTTFHASSPAKTYYIRWRAPASLAGTRRFCIRAFDRSGNASDTSCAALRLSR